MNLHYTLVIEILTFILLLFILSRVLYRPLLGFLDRRQEIIRGSIEEARRLKEGAERQLEESNKILRESKDKALKIKNQTDIELEQLKIEHIDEAKKEALRLTDEAKETIKKELDKAREKLKQETADISIAVAKKMLHREIDLKDHQRLVDEAIKELKHG